MAEDEKDKKRHELKTKRRDYTGYDDDEFAAGGDGLKRSVLAKYDEDLHGAPEKVKDSLKNFPLLSDPLLSIGLQVRERHSPSTPDRQRCSRAAGHRC